MAGFEPVRIKVGPFSFATDGGRQKLRCEEILPFGFAVLKPKHKDRLQRRLLYLVLGGPLADELRRRGYTILEFNGGKKPNQKPVGAEYQNLRTQAFWQLRERFQRGAIALPPGTDCELLTDELCATLWHPTPQGKLAIEEKDALAVRLQRSPDRADSLSMCFATVAAYSLGASSAAL